MKGELVRYATPVVLPTQHSHPLVRKLFEEAHRQRLPQKTWAVRAGLSHDTLKDWKTRSSPRLVNIEAAANVLGFELVLRRREE